MSVQEPMRTTIPAIVNSYPKNVGNQARVQAYWEGNETINKINIILQINKINEINIMNVIRSYKNGRASMFKLPPQMTIGRQIFTQNYDENSFILSGGCKIHNFHYPIRRARALLKPFKVLIVISIKV